MHSSSFTTTTTLPTPVDDHHATTLAALVAAHSQRITSAKNNEDYADAIYDAIEATVGPEARFQLHVVKATNGSMGYYGGYDNNYNAALDFLSFNGTLMNSITSLENEWPSMRFDLHWNYIPTFLQDLLLRGLGCESLARRFNAPARRLILTPFEYYFTLLALHLHLPSQHQSVPPLEKTQQSTAYFALISELLLAHLPRDPFHLTAHAPQGSSLLSSIGQTATDIIRTPLNLFQRKWLVDSTRAGAHQDLAHAAVQSEALQRVKFIVDVLCDVWLQALVHANSTTITPTRTLRGGPYKPDMFSGASAWSVRIFLKSVLGFVYSPIEAHPTVTAFRAGLIPRLLQVPVYSYLRCSFERWPMNASFRVVEEVWLSFIQPWRSSEDVKDAYFVDERRWLQFYSENYLVFLKPFHLLLTRLQRTNLVPTKNAQILHRFVKVLAVRNLLPLLRSVDNCVTGHSSGAAAQYSSSLMEHIARAESGSYRNLEHCALFGDQTKAHVRLVIENACHAAARLNSKYIHLETARDTSTTWLWRLCVWLGLTNDERELELIELKSTRDTVTQSAITLAELFGLDRPGFLDVSHTDLEVDDDPYPDSRREDMTGLRVLTPHGRYQVASKLKSWPTELMHSTVPPDIAPVPYRGEFGFAVSPLLHLSSWVTAVLNSHVDLAEVYARDRSWKGKLARRYLLQSSKEARYDKPSCTKYHIDLGVRVNLRPLAKWSVCLGLAFVMFSSYYISNAPLLFVLMVMIGHVLYTAFC